MFSQIKENKICFFISYNARWNRSHDPLFRRRRQYYYIEPIRPGRKRIKLGQKDLEQKSLSLAFKRSVRKSGFCAKQVFFYFFNDLKGTRKFQGDQIGRFMRLPIGRIFAYWASLAVKKIKH
jgi:hypothetical protein